MWAQFTDDPAEPGNKYKMTLQVSPAEAGRVYGAGAYSKGTKVEIYTYANEGYTFSCWKKGEEVVSTSSSFNYVMPNVRTTLTAVYTKDGQGGGTFNPDDPSEPNGSGNGTQDDKDTYSLTILKEPEKGGSINREGTISLKTGETIYLYASLAKGYEMDGWYIDGQLKSIQENYSYTMWEKSDTIVARFFYKPSDPSEPGHSENKEYIVISSQSDLEAYANVEEFPRSVRIIGTDITSLQSLSKMKKINGDLRIENTSLINLEGLDNLATITGKLVVSNNRLLVAMDGIYSWDNIFYVLIEDNPELTDFCAMTSYALKNNPAGSIRGNAYNPTFKNIADGLCSKNEDVFRVEETSVTRGVNQLKVKVKFTNEPYTYTSLRDYVSLASDAETLLLTKFIKSNLSYEFFFDAPKKEGEYVLTIDKSLKDTKGHTLNQNGNSYTEEEDDSYTERFNFRNNELYVVAQSPLTSNTYTDLVFNDFVTNIPLSNVSLVSPSGKDVSITSIELIDSITPVRHRVNYKELDEDGNYTFTLFAGLTSEGGKNMIYPYQSIIELPAANLLPESISPINVNWSVGEKQQIKYVVKNIGSKAAKGKCVDVIYLSSTESWNSDAIELYRDTVSIDVDAQGNYTQTVSIDVPTIVDGTYYLILKSNVTQSVKELTYRDNMLSVEGPSVSVEVLTDENNKFTLERGESKIFRIQAEPDKNVELIDKYGIANMHLGYFQLPTATESSNHGSITILGADTSIRYYLMVSNNSKNHTKLQQCELSQRNFELEVGEVGRTNIVKHKTAWIPVEVIGCTDMPTFYLMDTQGNKIECKQAIAKTETSFYAQFDTEVIASGSYSLYVECNGMTGLKDKAITINNEPVQEGVISKLVLPETSRIGSTITAYIDYYNSGNVDVPVPLFILTGQEGSVYELPTGGTFTSEAHIIGVNEEGVVSTLMPGESNRISVNITIPNEQISPMEYILKTITAGCEGIDEPFYLQWLDVEPDEVPSCYSDEEWSAYCNRLRNNVGDTWRTFIQVLGKAAEMFYTEENIDYNAYLIYDILKQIDLQLSDEIQIDKMRSRASLTLRDVESGTIFLWKNGKWNPVIEAEYMNVPWKEGFTTQFKQWKTLDFVKKVHHGNVNNYIISHGWRDDRNGKTIEIAKALAQVDPTSNIFGIDWSSLAWTPVEWFGLAANVPAVSIPHVADMVIKGLCAVFETNKNNLNLPNLHLIGHSHGAHVCGMIAHKLRIKPKRLTALDASTQLSHLFSSNWLGTGWNKSDAKFIDYYKSSIMAGTNKFKGHNNFILIEKNDGFTFDKSLNKDSETYRHGYSIDWYAKSIYNKSLSIGYNLSPTYLSKEWGKGFSEEQYHGVIHGLKDKIENFSIRNDYSINSDDWNYTEPWYGKKLYQGLFNDYIFRNAFASTIDYESMDLSNPDSNDYIQAGTIEELDLQMKNNADNFTVPLDIRQNETNKQTLQALFVSKHLPSNEHSYKKDKELISYIETDVDLYFLDKKECYCGPEEELKETFSFNINSDLWNKLDGGSEEFILCDFWFITAVDKSFEYDVSPIRNIKLWKGELYPHKDSDNCKKVTLKVRNPGLVCNAGEDQTITLDKGETTAKITVNGIVEKDNGLNLSYSWVYKNSEFSTTTNGYISLGVGEHTLTFRIEAKAEDNPGVEISNNEAEDDVVITVKPYTPGDEDDEGTNTASSWDPNEKVGIKGAGGKSAVKSGEMMEYTIYFENDAEKAQLAAQTVTVIDTLDVAFDLSTFEFTGSEVGNTYIDVPKGMTETCIYTDMRPGNNLILKTDMKLDIDSRIVTVVYTSLDTLTYEPTQDVFAGFLPPNDSTHVGEGHFSYRVKLKDEVENNYDVKNKADIYFDYNDVIVTNTTSHIVDTEAPVSTILPLPSITYEDSVEVSWSGSDNAAGIAYFDIYCSEDNGEYFIWKEHTNKVSEQFKGEIGKVYSFFAVATDSLGYTEKMKTDKEAYIEFAEKTLDVTIHKKWDDVLICDNTSGEFVTYQWYKDNILIEGATKQFYSEDGGLNGSYYVIVTTADGNTGKSNTIVCDDTSTPKMRVSPTILNKHEKCTITINNLPNATENLYMEIYNSAGYLVKRMALYGNKATFELDNSGLHIIKAVGLKDTIESCKIIVVE